MAESSSCRIYHLNSISTIHFTVSGLDPCTQIMAESSSSPTNGLCLLASSSSIIIASENYIQCAMILCAHCTWHNIIKVSCVSISLGELINLFSRDPAAAAARKYKPIQSAVPGTTLGPIQIEAFLSGGAKITWHSWSSSSPYVGFCGPFRRSTCSCTPKSTSRSIIASIMIRTSIIMGKISVAIQASNT